MHTGGTPKYDAVSDGLLCRPGADNAMAFFNALAEFAYDMDTEWFHLVSTCKKLQSLNNFLQIFTCLKRQVTLTHWINYSDSNNHQLIWLFASPESCEVSPRLPGLATSQGTNACRHFVPWNLWRGPEFEEGVVLVEIQFCCFNEFWTFSSPNQQCHAGNGRADSVQALEAWIQASSITVAGRFPAFRKAACYDQPGRWLQFQGELL